MVALRSNASTVNTCFVEGKDIVRPCSDFMASEGKAIRAEMGRNEFSSYRHSGTYPTVGGR